MDLPAAGLALEKEASIKCPRPKGRITAKIRTGRPGEWMGLCDGSPTGDNLICFRSQVESLMMGGDDRRVLAREAKAYEAAP